MLNELESIRRGLANAGISSEREHSDVQSVGKSKEPLLVRLGPNGELEDIELLPASLAGQLWTFRHGQHSSFPLVSPPPLLDMPNAEREAFNKRWKEARAPADRRNDLSQATIKYAAGGDAWRAWPGERLSEKLQSKRAILKNIEFDASAVPAIIDRFLAVFSRNDDGRNRLLVSLVNALVREIKDRVDDWLELARAALVGEEKKEGGKKKLVGGNFYFDIVRGEFARDVHDRRNRAAAARTLLESDGAQIDHRTKRGEHRRAQSLSESPQIDNGRCAITGEKVQLHRGNFPKPNLPIGQGFVFSKNQDLPAAGSYGRFGHDAFPVGRLIIGELAGAITELVSESRKGITWCMVPGERRKATDLLIAFVEGAPDAPMVGLFAGDADNETDELDPIAIYERRTERLIETAKSGKTPEDFRKTPTK